MPRRATSTAPSARSSRISYRRTGCAGHADLGERGAQHGAAGAHGAGEAHRRLPHIDGRHAGHLPLSSPAYLELIGGSTGVQAQGDLQVVSTINSGDITAEVLNLAATGNTRLLVACNAGSGELSASSAGGVQLYAQDQAIFLRTAATGPANLIVESNTGGANDGEVICNYGFQNLSDEKLKHNVEPAELEELQQLFDAVAPKWYRRTERSQKRTLGFIANEVQETGPVGQALCGSWTRSWGSSSHWITTACAVFCGESARVSRPAWRPWRRSPRRSKNG